MAFNFSDGDTLSSKYLKESDLIDGYIGNRLWTIGSGSNGKLGNNTNTNRSSPVQTIASGINWKSIGASSGFSASIKTDGTLWLWGRNVNGELGNNQTAIGAYSSPIQTVSSGTNWMQVSCGTQHTMAIKTDGTLWLWGGNTSGQLGTNNNTFYSSPVQTVSSGTNWKLVTSGRYHTVAIKTDGTLWAWGKNDLYGNLGDNTRTNRSSPVQTISSGTNWKLIGAGGYNTGAVKTDGSLWVWGDNTNGQLGDTTVVSKSSPIQTISGGTNWKQISWGFKTAFAIKTDGTLWTWGYNLQGQIGDNSTTPKSSPVQTISGGNNWKLVSGGSYAATAIKTDGTLWLWGYNAYGALGDNSNTDKSSPVQTIAGGTNWKLVTCGGYQVLGVTFSDQQ